MRLFKDEQNHLITEQERRQEFGLLKLNCDRIVSKYEVN